MAARRQRKVYVGIMMVVYMVSGVMMQTTAVTRTVAASTGGPYIMIQPGNQTVLEGQRVNFPCGTEGYPNIISHTWFKDQVDVRTSDGFKATRINILADGNLVIKTAVKADKGWYMCRASNGLGHDEASAYLNVVYKPVVLPLPTQLIWAKGYRQQIDCPVDSNPPLLHIIWVKDQDQLQSRGRFDVLDNGTLLVSDVMDIDAGSYRCTPENAMGQGLSSNRVQVMVKDPPQITVSPQLLYIRNVGQSVVMNCEATGTPAVSLQWIKVGGRLDDSTDRITVTDKYLEIKNLTKEDHGKYECRAINTIATVVSVTELRIDKTTPHAPFNVTVVPGLFNITISWEPAYDGGTPQFYVLWFRQISQFEWLTMAVPSQAVTYFNLYGLQPDTEYEFKILSRNSFGNGSFSEVVRQRTLGYSPDVVNVLPTDKDGNPYHPEINGNHGPEPSPPLDVTAQVKDRNILLKWRTPPTTPVPIFSYKIEYQHDGRWLYYEHRILGNATSTINNAIMPDMPTGTYDIYLRSYGVLAYSSLSNVARVHISGDDVVIPQAMVGGIIGGVLFLLVAILLALVAVFYSRRKERKAKEKKYDDVNYGKPDEMNGRHHESTPKRDRWQYNGGGDLVTSLNNTDSIFFLPQTHSFHQSASTMRPLILLDKNNDRDSSRGVAASGQGYDKDYDRQVPLTTDSSFMSDRSQPRSFKSKPEHTGLDVRNRSWPSQHDVRFEPQPLLSALHPSHGRVPDTYIPTYGYPYPQEYLQHSFPQSHPHPSHHSDNIEQFPSLMFQYPSHSTHMPQSYPSPHNQEHQVYSNSHPTLPQDNLLESASSSRLRQNQPTLNSDEYPSFQSEDDDVFGSLPQPSGHHQIPGFPRHSSMKPSQKTYLIDDEEGFHPDSLFRLKDISSVLDQSSELPSQLQPSVSQDTLSSNNPLNIENSSNIPGYYINTGDSTKPFAMVIPNQNMLRSADNSDGGPWVYTQDHIQGASQQDVLKTNSQETPLFFQHHNISGFSYPFPQNKTDLYDSSSRFSHSTLKTPVKFDTLPRDSNEDNLQLSQATGDLMTKYNYNELPRPRAHSEGSRGMKHPLFSGDDGRHHDISGDDRIPYNSASYPDISLPRQEKTAGIGQVDSNFPYSNTHDYDSYAPNVHVYSENQNPKLYHQHQSSSSLMKDRTTAPFHQQSSESHPPVVQRFAPRDAHPVLYTTPHHEYPGSQYGDDTIPADSGSHSSGIGSRNTSQSTSSYRPNHQGGGGKGSASFNSRQSHDMSLEMNRGHGIDHPIHGRDTSGDENYEFDSLNALENDIMNDLRRYSQLSGGSGNAGAQEDSSVSHPNKHRQYPDSERRFEKLREEFKQYRQQQYCPSDGMYQLPPTAAAALPIELNGEPLYPMDSEML